jgi:hypothetical protein
MTDNKKKQDGRDDNKIDSNDPNEVAYAAKQFGVTSARLKQAIEQVGNSREKVKNYLANN